MTGWAKRVDWSCRRPTETGPDWLARLLEADGRAAEVRETRFWAGVSEAKRRELAEHWDEWFPVRPDWLPRPLAVPSAHDDGETTIGAAGGEQSAHSGPESGSNHA